MIAPDTGSTATSYVDAGVSPSTTYVYAVVALSGAGEGAPSASASTTTPSQSPTPDAEAKPDKSGSDPILGPRNVPPASSTPGSTSLTLTPLFDRVTLGWNTPSGDGVTGYRIWRGASAGELTVLVSDTGSTSTSYVDETVEEDTTYHYAVAALNAAGAGPQSTSSIATLAAPRVTSLPTPEPEEPLIAAQQQAVDENRILSFNDNPIVTFASNLGKPDASNTGNNTLTSAEVRFQQSFTTGPGESGFLLNSFSFRAFNGNDFLIVSLWTDEVSEMGVSGPGEKLAELGRVEARYSDHHYTFEYLDVFLFPSTTYWIQFQVRHAQYDIKGSSAQTRLIRTTATDMDMGSLPGWSFGGDVKFGLKGRVVPFGRVTVDVEAELVSNLDNDAITGGFAAHVGATAAQSFTTGSSSRSYGLTAVRFNARTGTTPSLVVSIHEDNSGDPAATVLFTLTGPAISGSVRQEYTYSAPANARLDPDTTYWVVFSNSSGQLALTETQDISEQGIAAGWSIANRNKSRASPTAVWQQSTGDGAILMAVDGTFFQLPERVEPPGEDFPASEATPERVRLGEYSTGTLDDASDRDWFRIDGLEHYRQYRLEVDFLGANVVGGSLDIFSSTMGEPVVARDDLWDSNYDGHAVLDFWPVAVGLSTLYVQVESDNDMNREDDRNRYTGPYTITLSELPDVQRMVSNLEQRASDRLTFYNVGHLTEDGLTGHVKEMAIDFTTGSHAAGYTLDKLAAYISMGRRTVTVGTATITGVSGADVAIGPPAYSIVVDDRTLTVVEGFSVSYTVQLSTQPSADVTVVITGASDTDVTVTPASLTFTSSTWDQAQTVTVSSAEDPDSTDDDVTLAHTATGGGYTNLSAVARVAVRVDDNEDSVVADEPEDPGAPAFPVIGLVPTKAVPHVAIYSNSTNNVPGAELCQVERLTGYETGLVLATGDWPDEMYAGTCAGVTLEADTKYWIMFRSLSRYPNSFYRVAESNSNSEDPSGAAGWSIGNQTWSRLYNNTKPNEPWKTVSGSHPLAIGVYATPK